MIYQFLISNFKFLLNSECTNETLNENWQLKIAKSYGAIYAK